jgi:hypothetical protein
LRARNQQLTPQGQSGLDLFLTAKNQNGGVNGYISNPQKAISDFLESKQGQGSGILEPFRQSIGGVGEASKATAKELKALAGIVSNVGDGSAKAAKLAKEFAEMMYRATVHPGRPESVGSGGGSRGET